MTLVGPPKTFRDYLEEEGTETKLYLRRLRLINKPVDTWTEEDVNLTMRCSFEWMRWMQAIRNGDDFTFSMGQAKD